MKIGVAKLSKLFPDATIREYETHFSAECAHAHRRQRNSTSGQEGKMEKFTKLLNSVIETLLAFNNRLGVSVQLMAMFLTAHIYSTVINQSEVPPEYALCDARTLAAMQATYQHILYVAAPLGGARPADLIWPCEKTLQDAVFAYEAPAVAAAVAAPAAPAVPPVDGPEWVQTVNMLTQCTSLQVATLMNPGTSRYGQIEIPGPVHVNIDHDQIVTRSMPLLSECGPGARLFSVPGDGCCTARVMGVLHLIRTGQINDDASLRDALLNTPGAGAFVATAARTALEHAMAQGNPHHLEETKLLNLLDKLEGPGPIVVSEGEYADALSVAMNADSFLVNLNVTTTPGSAGKASLNLHLSQNANTARVPMGVVYTSKDGRLGHTSLIVGPLAPVGVE